MKIAQLRHCLLILFFLCNTTAMAEGPLRFAPLPMEKPSVVIKQFKPMLDFLSQKTGTQIEIVYFENYAQILDAFAADAIDLAFLGPLPYVLLRQKQAAAKPLVRFLSADGSDTYTCSLIRFLDTPQTPLQGRKIALTQPYSTCGYLAVSHLLHERGGDLERNQYRYTGTHAEVAMSVVRGEFELGGLKTSIGEQFAHMGLELFAHTKPLPGFVLTANANTLSEAQMQALRKPLLALKPLFKAEDKGRTTSWGKNVRYGAIPATDADFAEIRSQLKQLSIPLEGNF